MRIPKDESPGPQISQKYVTGLRGIVAVQSLLWAYLSTFAPAMVYPSSVVETHGPTWQYVLRDVFCASFWNSSLICAWFLILSARTACVPFLSKPTATNYAGSLIRRNFRIGIPISIALAVSLAVFTQIEHGYFDNFKTLLPGSAVEAPDLPQKPSAGVLSIYNLLWVDRNWAQQAGSTFWPTDTMWMPSLIYYQSYTVYTLMVILPFTRPSWHIQGLLIFALGSYWLESWAWYSATGLFLADLAIDPALNQKLRAGIAIKGNVRVSFSIPAVALTVLGLVQKYLWIAAFPEQINWELKLHPVYYTGGSAASAVDSLDPSQPYPRLDDWMVVVGLTLLVELYEPVQQALSVRPLTYLGDRSLSKLLFDSLLRALLTTNCRYLCFSKPCCIHGWH